MNMAHAFRKMLASFTCAAVIAGAPLTFAADEAKPKTEAGTVKKEGGEKKKEAERRGPIPELYGKVVAPDQKEKIYTIQDKYQAEMAPLVAKIKELQVARDKEIEAVLTPEQLTRLKELKAEQVKAAMAKREQMKKTEGKPAAEKSAEAAKPAAEKVEGGK